MTLDIDNPTLILMSCDLTYCEDCRSFSDLKSDHCKICNLCNFKKKKIHCVECGFCHSINYENCIKNKSECIIC